MPRTIYIKEIPMEGPYLPRFYEVSLPLASEKGFYRIIGSFNAFFHGGLTKPYRNWTSQRIFSYVSQRDSRDWFWDGFGGTFISKPSLYEFYLDIGYDRKNKRYNSGERLHPPFKRKENNA